MSPHDDRELGLVSGGQDASTRPPVTATVINYGETHLDERVCARPEDLQGFTLRPAVTWISVDGVCDGDLIQAIGGALGIHPLTQEDIMNIRQRPKLEDYGDYLYVAVRMLSPDGDGEFRSEQVSLVLGADYVVSFQEQPGGAFERIREHLRAGVGRFRIEGAGYLFYTLLDAIVDDYFVVIEMFGERIEVIEDAVVAEPGPEILQSIYALRRSLITLRRSAWPLRDVVAGLERGDSPLIPGSTLVYLRDVYDHTIQVAETAETYREMMSGVLDIYLSSQSNRTNEIMKVLTIIATIFIPLTFITGFYGMNFVRASDLAHPGGYPSVFALMIAATGIMVLYFRKKGWI